ncbi:carbon-nitrogen hydrolase family protein [Vibrio sp. 99-8-1]|uniref:carbon-nitrogen hydrolase family protein n=1 Tax=Vibrio sp. 99-8-1 TaxID=2607602 RepID=UPI0014939250|nr:carbon-nitrogen hydrolase family protein [Vibrio sp. 99-8-1]NOI65894.1 carbon-nitrogen hydrolase family protein [Vibrio sp. 99-8-1]
MASVGIVQMTSGPEPLQNLAFIEHQLQQLSRDGAKLVLTPENAIVFGNKADYRLHAEPIGDGDIQNALSIMAKRFNIWLVIGSFPIQREQRVTTTTLVYNNQGRLVSHYDKLHMFDVDVEDKHSRYRESEIFSAGDSTVVVDTPIGKLGLAICYDLRFPHLFSELVAKGAQVISLPAAFTATTGEAHWQTLLTARAIETQCWIIAAGQTGTHPCSRQTWGHSMVINPWGDVTKQILSEVGTIREDIEHGVTDSVRSNMPLSSHARFQSQLKQNKGLK